MSDDLEDLVQSLAETMVTGSVPGKPAQPFIPRFYLGTVTAVAGAVVTVQFPAPPGVGTIPYLVAGIPCLDGPPAVGTTVVVLQLPHQRLVLGVVGFDTLAWTAVSYQNGWVDYGSGYYGVGYAKDSHGIVHLRGLMKSGSMSTTAFTLPNEFRPASHTIYGVTSNGAWGYVTIQNDGQVVINAGSNVWMSLDGITIPT